MTAPPALSIRGLTRRYGEVAAVEGFDPGEGLLWIWPLPPPSLRSALASDGAAAPRQAAPG